MFLQCGLTPQEVSKSKKVKMPICQHAVQQTQISFNKAAPEIALYCHFREIFSTNIKISVLNQDEMGNLGWQKRPVCCHFIYFPHYFLCSSKCSCVGNDSPTNFHFLFCAMLPHNGSTRKIGEFQKVTHLIERCGVEKEITAHTGKPIVWESWWFGMNWNIERFTI